MAVRSVSLDAARLRALAHPLRVQLLALLRIGGAATASGLAQRLGTSSGLTSYHLRQLADAGLVAEDVERGTARERWWEAAHDTSSYRPSEVPDEATEVVRWLEREADRIREQERSTWIAERSTWSPEWADVADQSDYYFRVTSEELRSLLSRVHDTLRTEFARTVERRDGQVPTPDDTELVRLHVLAFPVREVAGVRMDDP